MAGVKGKSGGPRPNSGGARPNSGGARPGAGRPPKNKDAPPVNQPAETAEPSATEFLRRVMQGQIIPTVAQLDAAKALARIEAAPAGGKKAATAEAAKAVASGRFGPAEPPRLVANNVR